MLGIRPFLCGLIAGGIGGLFISNYHVVHTNDGVVVVPRTQRPPLRSSYVDIRDWSAAMWTNHPEVTQALIADGRSSLIGENLKDNMLEELLPEQTRSAPISRSRHIAQRKEIPIESTAAVTQQSTSDSAATGKGTARLLDSSSTTRQRWEAELQEVVAPLVEDDPEDLVAEQSVGQEVNEVLPEDVDSDAVVKQIESRLEGLLQPAGSSVPPTRPATGGRTEPVGVIPTSTQTNEMARDLLKDVIPQNTPSPRSAAPLRKLGLDFLNAPAPGQGATSSGTKNLAPTQSQLPQSDPF